MAETTVKINNLSKRYRIGEAQKGYKTIRETIMEGISAPVRNFGKLRGLTEFKSGDEENVIWALKDVSFDVIAGETLGIIGRNGAGKTTLLKILSRITEPSTGFIEVFGRVSSLLEVGTGFHPELTGRENIFLNGAILGMRKKEIERKFNDIVSFSEIEKYIDTPVKRYSSGMYVRLAFAVAAHLETDILLVDEVLAVGDIAFQKKCLGKMGDITKEGRTVLFISHNMGAIQSLCSRAIWLDNGQIVKNDLVDETVRAYEENQLKLSDTSVCLVERKADEVKNKNFYISRIEILNAAGQRTDMFKYRDTLILNIDLSGYPETRSYNLEFRIYNELGQFVCVGSSAFHGILLDKKSKKVKIEIGPLILTKGKYEFSLSAVDSQGGIRYDNWNGCCHFNIFECVPFGYGHSITTLKEGVCILGQSFTIEE
jgi:lipopolysaccharide transport system ATP-binding protein